MHLILTGATGLCGSAVLDAMIRTKDITKISIISRRPVKMAEDAKDPRINVILHQDFNKYDADLLQQVKGATGCVWALGISQTQVGKEEYIKITKDYALSAAEAFQGLANDTQQPFNFIYVSGEGATTKPNPGPFTSLFARVKGETEVALAELNNSNNKSSSSSSSFFNAASIRPGFIDAATHTAIKTYLAPRGLAWNAMEMFLGPPVRRFVRNSWSPTEALGQFMVDMATGKVGEKQLQGQGIEKVGGHFSIVNNAAFRRLAGLN